MPDIDGRDPRDVAIALSRWLEHRLGDASAPLVDSVECPASNGFSNETILCRAEWTDQGRRDEHRLVVRVAPTKHQLFLDADFGRQYRLLDALQRHGVNFPLPAVSLFEADPKWFGVPFFTMARIDGQVPSDNIPYTMEGWVLDGTDEQRSQLWWSGLRAMAEIHATDWRAAGLDWLCDPTAGRPGIDEQLAYYRRFLAWSGGGTPQPTAEAALAWLEDHRPDEAGDLVLCWGDARIGNMIFDEFNCVAVLDWEMATLGQPEMDLGWWLYFDRQFSEGLEVARPGGFGDHDSTIAYFEERAGRPMRHLDWYQIFSGFRFSVIIARLAHLLRGADILPMESDFQTNNFATQFLAKLLDLPAPG